MPSSDTEAVFVNVIDIDPARYQELVEVLKEGNDRVIRRRDGFISALIVASADRRRVITVARWRSAEAVRVLQNDPIVASYVKRTAAIATASPGVFGLVAEYRP